MTSAVYDFPSIKSKLRGDDWWEPVKCEAPPVGGSGGEPALAAPQEDGVFEGCVFREAPMLAVGSDVNAVSGMTMAEIVAASNEAIEYFLGPGAVMYNGVIIRHVENLSDPD